MSSFEDVVSSYVTDRHSMHVADLAFETLEFLKTYTTNPEVALAFWERICGEFTEKGTGYSQQEFEALSWEADNLVGLLGEEIMEEEHA
jgi:hypothetical protein